jgi:hypothetical protein
MQWELWTTPGNLEHHLVKTSSIIRPGEMNGFKLAMVFQADTEADACEMRDDILGLPSAIPVKNSAASLFQRKTFKMHSGQMTNFKIECDNLSDEDIETFAMVIAEHIVFGRVVGVPTGGIRIAKALEKYCDNDPNLPVLLVDDVLTTGKSMEEVKDELVKEEDIVIGVVLFARGPCPAWIHPVFQMWGLNVF